MVELAIKRHSPNLWNNLAKDHDTEGGADDGDNAPAAGERVEQDGEGVVDEHVAQQDGAQQEVAHTTDWHDSLNKIEMELMPIALKNKNQIHGSILW